jgi:hypothetical protein
MATGLDKAVSGATREDAAPPVSMGNPVAHGRGHHFVVGSLDALGIANAKRCFQVDGCPGSEVQIAEKIGVQGVNGRLSARPFPFRWRRGIDTPATIRYDHGKFLRGPFPIAGKQEGCGSLLLSAGHGSRPEGGCHAVTNSLYARHIITSLG